MCSLTSLASSTKRNGWPERRRPATRGTTGRSGRQWPPTPGPGREAHEPERLRRRGVDRAPDVDAEVAGEHRELVDERDVHVPERVLEQLHQLGLGGRSDRARPCRRARRRTPRRSAATPRRSRTRPSACSRTSSRGCRGRCARASSREEVGAGPEARAPRGSAAAAPRWCPGRSSTRGSTERAGRSTRRERPGRGLDVREVGRAVAQRRRHGDHRDVEAGEVVDLVASRCSPRRARPAEPCVGTSSTYERPARSARDPIRVHLVAHDVEARPRPRASRPAGRRSPARRPRRGPRGLRCDRAGDSSSRGHQSGQQ